MTDRLTVDRDDDAIGATAAELADPMQAHAEEGPRHRAADQTLDYAEYRARGRIPALDGVRAVSILLVVTAHVGYSAFWDRVNGVTGVSIFFVLSGYLITTLALREEDRYGNVDLVAFYIRRLFRIYPMFFLVLLAYVLMIMVLHLQPERREAFAANLPWFILGAPEHSIFFNSYPVAVPFDGAWSIGIEEKFYLVWPALGFVFLVAQRRRWRLPIVLLTFLAGVLMGWWDNSWGHALAPYGLIAIGVAGALVLHSPRGYARARILGEPRVLVSMAVVFAILQLGVPAVRPGHTFYVLYGLVITPLLMGIIVTRSGALSFLQSRPLVAIGVWSYALYLTHNFGLNFAEKLIPGSTTNLVLSALSTVIGIGSAIVGCAILHRVYEDPLHRLGQRTARGHRQRTPHTVSQADNP